MNSWKKNVPAGMFSPRFVPIYERDFRKKKNVSRKRFFTNLEKLERLTGATEVSFLP